MWSKLFLLIFLTMTESFTPVTSRRKNRPVTCLIPSQVPGAKHSALFGAVAAVSEESSDSTNVANPQRKRAARRNRKKRPPKKNGPQTSRDATDSFPLTGNLPDIFWRAVPFDHLRQHPKWEALPEQVVALNELEDVRFFRQDSWQWDALHAGRCTTSQAAAALGFLEETTGQILQIPPSWRRGGRGAYHRLREPALRTLDEMQKALLEDSSGVVTEELSESQLWEPQAEGFMANYTYRLTPEEVEERRKVIKAHGRNTDYLDRKIRLLWGNTQEATSLLTSLNYFARSENAVLREVGMCGAGLDLNQTASGLLVGASPDGVIVYPDGRIEALEVKNHCPFYSNSGRRRHQGKVKRFSIGDRPVEEGSVMAQYVSQLQLEMMCLGPACRSAVMVRQTATQGAMILRMDRDDKWIDEMLHFLQRFQNEYVLKEQPPSTDFFWNNTLDKEEQSRYRRFVSRTSELRNCVRVVAKIPPEEIQRMDPDMPMFLD